MEGQPEARVNQNIEMVLTSMVGIMSKCSSEKSPILQVLALRGHRSSIPRATCVSVST